MKPIKFSAEQRFRHASHVSWRKVGKEAVVLDLNSNNYFSVREVGSFIWEKLGGGATLAQVRSQICRRYHVKPDAAQRDIESFVKDLCRKELLVPRKG